MLINPNSLYITKLFGVDIQENRSRMQIVNNNTNDKQTSGASLALDEDSPYTNLCLFTLDRLPLLLLLRKN